MRTPPARSPDRWPRAAATARSDWPKDGTAPTGCSALWMPEGCPGDRPRVPRACVSVRRHAASRGILRTLAAEEGSRMKILMVSWEDPPVVIGGLGRHVHHLSTALAAAGHDVVVLSRRPTGTDPSTHPSSDEISEGVRVIAAAQDPHEFTFGDDMMAWVLAMGHAMVRAGLSLKRPGSERPWHPDVVHAHDWLVAHPAVALAQFYDVPLISTIHATEAGRHSGWVSGEISRQVHAVESWLVRESDSLITCSASMGDEITELFGPGLAEITVIPNGIDAARWPFAKRRTRNGPPELLYVGRLEYEKGVHDAIAALPRIRRTHPGTTLPIAGTGTQQDWLVEQARKYKVAKATQFAGHCEHAELLALPHPADG